MSATVTTQLQMRLREWQAQLQSWSASGALLGAVSQALDLESVPPSLGNLNSRLAAGEWSDLPRVELLNASEMDGAIGAWAGSTRTIYLNSGWLSGAQAKEVIAVLTEELGHFLDSEFNKNETRGDEGELLRRILSGEALAAAQIDSIKHEDDALVLKLSNGTKVKVEAAAFAGDTGSNNLIGSDSDDALDGGGGDDNLIGLAGNDTLNGGTGKDAMVGGSGNDMFIVDSVLDTITELPGEGSDTVQSDITFTLATLVNVENVTLAGSSRINATGSDANNLLTGSNGANVLDGGRGMDILNGGDGNDSLLGNDDSDTLSGGGGEDTLSGGAGADSMAGGSGNDTYVVDNADDVTIEAEAEGTDTVQAIITLSIADFASIENIALAGSSAINATGNDANNLLTGSNGANVLDGGNGMDTLNGGDGNDSLLGNDGNDTLNGGGGEDTLSGGAGIDSMAGGSGNDIYVVGDQYDVIAELLTGGIDTVQAAVSISLEALRCIENASLVGASAINATGGNSGNVLTGNNAINTLDGGKGDDTIHGGDGSDNILGGAGNDSLGGDEGDDNILGGDGSDTINGGAGSDAMTGGLNNDIYVVDNADDTITEAVTGGVDTIQTAVSFSMYGIAYVENMTLVGGSAVNATGNDANNLMAGNNAANILDGRQGIDTLNGGDGSDTLLGGAGNDSIDGGAGMDAMAGGFGNDIYVVDNIKDFIEEAEDAGTDTVQSAKTQTLVENVENLTLTGTGAINGTGNASANAMIGNAVNNALVGGAGADTLTGGLGADTFRFALTDSLFGVTDRITDFSIGMDTLDGPTAVSTTNTKELGKVAKLNEAEISAILKSSVFGANQAATFTVTSGATTKTYLAVNDSTAGFSSTSDGLIEITGYKGLLANLEIV